MEFPSQQMPSGALAGRRHINMPDLDCFEHTGAYEKGLHIDSEGKVIDRQSWPPRRIIRSCLKEKGPLFTRYYLFESKPLSIYIHCFHTSDDDRAMHDHPWSFISFLFHRGYYEITDSGTFWRRRFSILYRPATWKHIVILKKPNTWTLVFRFKRIREWGFWVNGSWMDWRAYGKEWCD